VSTQRRTAPAATPRPRTRVKACAGESSGPLVVVHLLGRLDDPQRFNPAAGINAAPSLKHRCQPPCARGGERRLFYGESFADEMLVTQYLGQ
jgi:hypothetical protein